MKTATIEKTKTEYSWRDGFRAGVDADVAARAIEKIASRYGHCAPQLLVKEAKNKKSPLHGHFYGKSDAEYAEEYRLQKARWMLSALRAQKVVVTIEGKPETVTAPCYVHARPRVSTLEEVPEGLERDGRVSTYLRVETAAGDPETQQQVLSEAMAMIGGLRRRFEFVTALGDVAQRLRGIEVDLQRRLKQTTEEARPS